MVHRPLGHVFQWVETSDLVVQPINQIMTSRPRHVKIEVSIIKIIMTMVGSLDPDLSF